MRQRVREGKGERLGEREQRDNVDREIMRTAGERE